MSPKSRKLRQATLFYAISLGLAIALAAAAPLIGRGVLLLTMCTPAVAVVVCRVFSPEGRRFHLAELGLSRLGLRHWPFALLIAVLALLPGYLLVWGTGIGGLAATSWDWGLLKVVVSFTIAIVFGAAICGLGEEVGWRATCCRGSSTPSGQARRACTAASCMVCGMCP